MKKNEISLLNVIFCLLVIFIHICSEPVTALTRGTYQHILIYTGWKLSGFVVQGFILLSGVKMFLTNRKESYFVYQKARIQKIVMPYLLAVTVYYLYFIHRGYFGFSWSDLGGYMLKGDLAAQFYFVIVIMQFYLLKKLWDIMLKKVPAILGISISAIITGMGIFTYSKWLGIYNDRVFTTYLIYWIIGCYIGNDYERFMTGFKKKRMLVLFGFIPVALAEVIFGYTKAMPYYLSEILHILYCLSAIFASAAIATYAGGIMKNRLLKIVNGASYYIYLWHVLILFIVDSFMDGISSIGIRFVIRGVVVYAISIVLCGIYTKIKKKIRG